MNDSSVLFVHGSFLPSLTWIPVIERLAQHGQDSHTIDLPFTSLADDVEALRNKISDLQKTYGAVSVVGHSYTGITVSAASHAAQHLVFVAARMPALGESQAAISPQWGNPEFRSCLNISADGELSLTEDAERFLFHRSPKALARLAMQHRRPMRSEIPVEPMESPAWLTVPSSYIVCTDDQAVQLDQQRMRAGWAKHSVEIDTDHSPFFSAPQATADFIFETHRTETA